MSDNMIFWDNFSRPPVEALKTIRGGRLSGMTDVKPQWRYMAMTAAFGPCGIGWKFTIDKKWLEADGAGQVCSFADVSLYVKDGDKWSDPIPGHGGSKFVAKETDSFHTSDECFKMAITDALSVAMKMLGVASDIYMGMWDGSKYKQNILPPGPITKEAADKIYHLIDEVAADQKKFTKFFGISNIEDLQASRYAEAIKLLEAKR